MGWSWICFCCHTAFYFQLNRAKQRGRHVTCNLLTFNHPFQTLSNIAYISGVKHLLLLFAVQKVCKLCPNVHGIFVKFKIWFNALCKRFIFQQKLKYLTLISVVMCSTEIPAQNTYGQKIILIILNIVHSVKGLCFCKIK